MSGIGKQIKKNRLTLIGVVLGGVAGYLYYHFIGCSSGSCPISSSPWLSVLWGMAFGGVLFSLFKRDGSDENDH